MSDNFADFLVRVIKPYPRRQAYRKRDRRLSRRRLLSRPNTFHQPASSPWRRCNSYTISLIDANGSRRTICNTTLSKSEPTTPDGPTKTPELSAGILSPPNPGLSTTLSRVISSAFFFGRRHRLQPQLRPQDTTGPPHRLRKRPAEYCRTQAIEISRTRPKPCRRA